MIEKSIKRVDVGTKLAKETAGALDEIVQQVETVSKLVNAISVSSREQAMGIDQVNEGVIQVSKVVQTNAATSQESAAASEELSGQAAGLKETVATFKLKGNGNSLADSTTSANLRPAISSGQKGTISLEGKSYGKY